ncbi:hypothetical protein F5888DRAFT_1716169, partial [Russula emetica]
SNATRSDLPSTSPSYCFPSRMDVSIDPTMSTQASLAIMKVWYTLNEFIITLDYEWRVIRGHLPYRWTIWVYSLTRVAALVGVIFCIVGLDVTIPLHCQLWISFSVVLIDTASIAIWNRNKVVITLSIIVWLHAVWDPAQDGCDPVNTKSSVLSLLPAIISNLVLLLIMLVGLFILRRHDGGTFGLSRVLWKQVCWRFSLAVVFMMFETPCLVMMIIAATRMHRYLIDFASKPPDLEHQNVKVSNLVFARPKQTDTTPTTLSRIEHPTAQKSDDYSSYMNTNEQGSPTGPTSDNDSSTIISTSEHMSRR